jgi:hypothetical protein
MLFSKFRTAAISASMALALFGATVEEAEAVPVTAIYLAIDSSGSILQNGFELQRDAYASLLSGIATDGSLAIGVSQFSSTINEEFALTVIDSEQDRTNLINAINAMSWLDQLTNISGAIEAATTALTNAFTCTEAINCLIDVSTDGFQVGFGGTPAGSAADAITAGVDQVNCVGIGNSADCTFIAGTDSFFEIANDFDGFAAALRKKLAREGVIDPIPLPATAWMLFAGLGGLAAMKRRK